MIAVRRHSPSDNAQVSKTHPHETPVFAVKSNKAQIIPSPERGKSLNCWLYTLTPPSIGQSGKR